ncbi:FG-GAP repeat domain-containing protein [Streptomyces sp. R39]|uniref:FG-GAP repeat domain-containing protein n=1 Tax=Streptomyces sp. R39 TaxID=3238631 RepID=A0AB39QN94_9ACTN
MPTRIRLARRKRRTFTRTTIARLSTATALAVVVSAAVLWSAGSAPTATTTTANGSDAQPVAGGTPMLPLLVRRTSDGHLLTYEPKGTGGVKAALDLGAGFSSATAIVRANNSDSGSRSDLYIRMGNALYYTAERSTETKLIGSGWDQYNLLMSPGDLGGTTQPDLLARDSAGALWLYQGKADGTLATKVRAGTGGWNSLDILAGYGDYTGDGKTDLLARTPAGALYLYPGTGNATADAVFGARVSVGTGWQAYNALVSTGDNDGDGKTDLLARDTAGALWLFKGTGTSTAPFATRVQIGTSGWNAFNALF